MPLLDAALAFALTILVLATIATVLVQVLQDVLRIRARTLRRLLRRYYEEDIKEVLGEEAKKVAEVSEEKIKQFVKVMTENHATGKIGGKVSGYLTTPSLTKLNRDEFIKRLRNSEWGSKFEKEFGGKREEIYKWLAARYDVAMAGASDLFTRKSRWFSIVIGIAIAFFFNVDSLRLLNTYLNNDEARNQVIARQEVILGQYEAIVAGDRNQRTSPGQSDRESSASPGEVSNPGKNDTSSAGTEDKNGAADKTRADIEKSVKELRKIVGTLQQPKLPIGWDLFPNCPVSSTDVRCTNYWQAACTGDQGTLECREDVAKISNVVALSGGLFLTWLIGVLMTGLLVGMGAPFWYDVVSGIARAAQDLRGRGQKRKPEDGT